MRIVRNPKSHFVILKPTKVVKVIGRWGFVENFFFRGTYSIDF